jgi:hypothetical protein
MTGVSQYEVSISHLAKAQVTKSTSGSRPLRMWPRWRLDFHETAALLLRQYHFQHNAQRTQTKINDQHSGVIASIVNDGTNYKLVITGRETGEDTINNTLTNSGGLAVRFGLMLSRRRTPCSM